MPYAKENYILQVRVCGVTSALDLKNQCKTCDRKNMMWIDSSRSDASGYEVQPVHSS
jgi:hypothetical protein